MVMRRPGIVAFFGINLFIKGGISKKRLQVVNILCTVNYISANLVVGVN